MCYVGRKAFDRVHFVKLFNVLLKKGICPTLCRLLAFMYTNQTCSVRWGATNCQSPSFNIYNGVKQGGVVSPQLFSLYLDTLLVQLADSGFGFHIGNSFAGSVAFADYIVLLYPSIHGLKEMINICETYSSI